MNRIVKFAAMLAMACLAASATAQSQGFGPSDAIEGPADAPEGAEAIPLYGEATPGSLTDEVETRFMGRETVIRNVTYPTLTPVLPEPGKATGAAVIVAPGGGFMFLAMQNEGWRVAQALADRGIAAFVLKYRLNPTPREDSEFYADMGRRFSEAAREPGERPAIDNPEAFRDGLAALKLLRARASEWNVDPRRVGMIGFSAGAMTTLQTNLLAPADDDPATNPPDFAGYIYGPMNSVEVPPSAPPMFAALAMDDPLFGNGDFSIVSAWQKAERPVELHVYEQGGHGYGLGKSGTTTTLMMQQFIAWLEMRGYLDRKDGQ